MPPRKQQIELPDEVTEHAPDTLMGLDVPPPSPENTEALEVLRSQARSIAKANADMQQAVALKFAGQDYRRLALEWAVKIAPPNVHASEVISNAVLFERFLKGDNG